MQFTVNLPPVTSGTDKREVRYGWLQTGTTLDVGLDQKTVAIETDGENDFGVVVVDFKGSRAQRARRASFRADGTPLPGNAVNPEITLTRGAVARPAPPEPVEEPTPESKPTKRRSRKGTQE